MPINEVWAKGSKPGDEPVQADEVPDNPHEIARFKAHSRLSAIVSGRRKVTDINQTLRNLIQWAVGPT